MTTWETVIGLEVHAQMTTASKLFSSADATFGGEANQHVSFVDAGFPGMLPVLNEGAIRQAVMTGLGLNAKINLKSAFDRKNYFYADLPTGYQISQNYHPIVGEGCLYIDREDGTSHGIGIERLHIEQDAGKSIHDQSPTETYIDLNRAGVPLMEIVTKPDLRSAEDVSAFIKKIKLILSYLGTCDGNMEQGSLRCDVNVSVRPKGSETLGTRCEIKNMNSIKFIGQAIAFERQRQIDVLESGGTIDQETRLFDTDLGITRTMRSKENAEDYRYFPDPDLLPVVLSQSYVDDIAASLPELPDQKNQRLRDDHGLSAYDASVLITDKAYVDFFEEMMAHKVPAKLAANWMMGELFGALNKVDIDFTDSPINAKDFSDLLLFIEDGTISGKIAKDVFAIMFETRGKATDIIEEKGLKQVSDTGEIDTIIQTVLAENIDKVTDYRSGKDRLFGFFVGQVMKQTGGKANPKVVNDLLKQALQG
jgi:aspartyl-tRNA(Asn)/glutamyl-tRNA(Gln) amidotransferase subunit B